MGGERPDPLVRLDATNAAVRSLPDILTVERQPLDVVLARVAAMAARAIPDADAVTITVLTQGTPRTAAWTDEQMVDLDTSQYAANRGPCLESARTHRAVRAVVRDMRARWPEFADAAERAGLQAYVSAPLLVTGVLGTEELVGSLNMYSRTTKAFDPFDEGLLRLYTTAAIQAIDTAHRWRASRDTVSQLETALASRGEIDQAKGILMALHGCSAEEAFTRLVRQSQQTNVKVSKVARELLASVRDSNNRSPRA